jgi:adenine phosphoribosyltransferase
MRNEHLLRLIRTIPDVPQPGVMFRDITPLLASPEGFAATVQELVAASEGLRPTKVVGVEARGFILAAPVAQQLGAGFVRSHRKPSQGRIEESRRVKCQ